MLKFISAVFFCAFFFLAIFTRAVFADDWSHTQWISADEFVSLDSVALSDQKLSLKKTDAWWNGSGSEWHYRIPLKIQNASQTEPLPSLYTIRIPVDLPYLYANSMCRYDFNDLRVLYRTQLTENQFSWTPLNRVIPVSNAVYFKSYNDRIDASGFTVAGRNALTIEAFVRLDELPEPGKVAVIFIEEAVVGSSNKVLLGITDNHNVVFEAGGSGQFISVETTEKIIDRVWTHIAGCFDGTGLRIYINGVLCASLSINAGAIEGTPGLCWINSPNTVFKYTTFKGGLDALRVSGTARYQEQFNPSRAEYSIDENTLVAWHFNETAGNTVSESSGNYAGTVSGDCYFAPGHVFQGAVLFRIPADFSIPASVVNAESFWLYFGNPSAGTAPDDPGMVYLFHDAFNLPDIDTSKWVVTGTDYSIQDGMLRRYCPYSTTSLMTTNSDNFYVFDKFRLEFEFRTGYVDFGGILFQYYGNPMVYIMLGPGGISHRILGDFNISDPYSFETVYSAAVVYDGYTMGFYINNAQKLSGTVDGGTFPLQIGSNSYSFLGESFMDNYRVSKYFEPVPAVIVDYTAMQTLYAKQGACVSKIFDTQFVNSRIESAHFSSYGGGSAAMFVRGANDPVWFAINPESEWRAVPLEMNFAYGRYLQYKIILYGSSENPGPFLESASVTYNLPPSAAANIVPADGAMVTSMPVVLEAGGFVDLNAADYHTASQWQIRTASGNYGAPVLDTDENAGALLSLSVPDGVLADKTVYYWRVRFKDNHANYLPAAWGEFSNETSFTITLPEPQITQPPPDNQTQYTQEEQEGSPVQEIEISAGTGPAGQNDEGSTDISGSQPQTVPEPPAASPAQDGEPFSGNNTGNASAEEETGNENSAAAIDSGADDVSQYQSDNEPQGNVPPSTADGFEQEIEQVTPIEAQEELPAGTGRHGKNSGRCFIRMLNGKR